MDVYLMGIVFCPMNREEQDADLCLRCRHFGGHKVADRGTRRGRARLYVNCQYDGVGEKIYESTKSKHRVTVVADEPMPPTPDRDEEWRKTG